MLTWVTFAERPLTVEEFQDAVAMPSSPKLFCPDPSFLARTRVSDLDARIKACCGPLIEIRTPIIQLLHLTAREYLLRQDKSADPFDTDEERGDAEISSCCIRYLRLLASRPQPKATTSWNEQDYDELVKWFAGYPLLNYVLQYLPRHVQTLAENSTVLADLSLFLQSLQNSDAFLSLLGDWTKDLTRLGHTDLELNLNRSQVKLRCLLAAAKEGLTAVVESMIHLNAAVNGVDKEIGITALVVSSIHGHSIVVEMLIEHGADLNAQGGHYDNALQAALINGHSDVAQRLIECGADVNAQGGHYGNALQAALINGHSDVARRLIECGADVNAQGGRYGNALQAALINGHSDVARRLIECGADVNAQGGRYGNALQAASINDHSDVVKFLLEHGAAPP